MMTIIIMIIEMLVIKIADDIIDIVNRCDGGSDDDYHNHDNRNAFN